MTNLLTSTLNKNINTLIFKGNSMTLSFGEESRRNPDKLRSEIKYEADKIIDDLRTINGWPEIAITDVRNQIIIHLRDNLRISESDNALALLTSRLENQVWD